jgi:Na+-transporting methylmalonyl-CoA/oxaloacetate decarboxylase gamma subunit
MEILWTQALLVSLVGFGSVFALLALLAVIVEITGRIISGFSHQKTTPAAGETGREDAEIRQQQRTGGL